MINAEELFVMDINALREDLYRMGNASSMNFTESRSFVDCRIVDRDGIKFVIGNGNGFSAFNRVTTFMKSKGKNVWKIRKNSPLPNGLKIVKHLTNEGHFMLAPANDMPLRKYLGLLEELSDPRISVKLSLMEITDAK